MVYSAVMPLDYHKIGKLRRELELSQVEAARQSGLSRQGWINLETGSELNPTISTVSAIAKVLQVSPNDLIKWK
jgi:DNA-binding XRE family transcriptional regulator